MNDFAYYNNRLSWRERKEKFINEQYVNYLEEFNVGNIDEYTKICLIKVILNRIICNRIIIDKIKKGANICD